MAPETDLAGPIRGFFEHHLVSQRGLSGHTVLAYRDGLKLFLTFATERCRKPCTRLHVDDLTADLVRRFLEHLETARHNTVRTRNSRLAAIHSFFRYLASLEPRCIAHCQTVLAVPFKRYAHRVPEYLEREEVLSVFENIDRRKALGRRDDALLRLLYNTGMRAQELVDLDANHVRFSRPWSVRIQGKGHRERTCPLWKETIQAMRSYLDERAVRPLDAVPLFVNSKGARLTRFGLRCIIDRRVAAAAERCPSLTTRTITPHTIRHTTAMHLLQSGVELNMIRSWLGHASIETTHGYVEIDLEMKRKTLQSCEGLLPKTESTGPSWRRDPDLLEWLARL
jgi:site-specific recombinase XerD